MSDSLDGPPGDSVLVTFFADNGLTVLYVDSSKFVELPEHYIPGLKHRFSKFRVPGNTDSLRLQFQAILTGQNLTAIDSVSIDTVLYRWERPPNQD